MKVKVLLALLLFGFLFFGSEAAGLWEGRSIVWDRSPHSQCFVGNGYVALMLFTPRSEADRAADKRADWERDYIVLECRQRTHDAMYWGDNEWNQNVQWTSIVVHTWAPAMLFALAFCFVLIREPARRRRRRTRDGLCAACGYDLRGSESGECPECGAGR